MTWHIVGYVIDSSLKYHLERAGVVTLLLIFIVAPATDSIVPLLVNPLVLIVSAWPDTSAEMVPSFTTELAEL